MDNQQGPTVQHRELSSTLCGSQDRRGEFRGEWIHVHVWLSAFCCSPETVATLLTGYTPIQNKKLKKIRKESLP